MYTINPCIGTLFAGASAMSQAFWARRVSSAAGDGAALSAALLLEAGRLDEEEEET